jgi:uncharacterized membrane protein YhiD involved in acid resistance
MSLKEYVELLLSIIAVLVFLYGLAKVVVTLQFKSRQNSKETASHDEILTSINEKLEQIGSDINHHTLKLQNVERDGIENIRLTRALHERVDKVDKVLKYHRIKQVRLEETIKSLKLSQRFKLGTPNEGR